MQNMKFGNNLIDLHLAATSTTEADCYLIMEVWEIAADKNILFKIHYNDNKHSDDQH